MSRKVTFIISNINKALAFEWIAENLDKNKFDLNFILLNNGDSQLEAFLKQKKIAVTRVTYAGKMDIPRAFIRVVKLLFRIKPDVVHTHLFDASMIGLNAALIAGVSKRIHTRHHSNYHHVYFPHMVKYDKFINLISTDIVAISETVKEILIKIEKANTGKVHLIHHGFDLKSFENISNESIEIISAKYNPSGFHPVVGVISRYTEWKGIQFIIPAFEKLLQTFPGALLILANAEGNYKHEIKNLLRNIPEINYKEISFEEDIFSLYKLFDLFVHVPIDKYSEAFGQTYVEALASGIPSVFTLSGIANEFIADQENALVVPYQNSETIHQAMIYILHHKEELKKMTAQGRQDVYERFRMEKMIHSLEQLYSD